MSNERISYETALLLRSIGYNEPCKYCYAKGNTIYCRTPYPYPNGEWKRNLDVRNYYSAPTRHELADWLRKTHKIFVVVDVETTALMREELFLRFSVKLIEVNEPMEFCIMRPYILFPTWEAAFEHGLQEALKTL